MKLPITAFVTSTYAADMGEAERVHQVLTEKLGQDVVEIDLDAGVATYTPDFLGTAFSGFSKEQLSLHTQSPTLESLVIRNVKFAESSQNG